MTLIDLTVEQFVALMVLIIMFAWVFFRVMDGAMAAGRDIANQIIFIIEDIAKFVYKKLRKNGKVTS